MHPLRPNVCMLVVSADNKYLLAQRHGSPEVWQFPQGGADPEESLEENALRELHEELGAPIDCFSILARLEATHSYEFDKPRKYGGTKYRGQTQTFFLVRFTGSDEDIQLDRYEQELSDFRWCSAGEVEEHAEPRRVGGYRAPLAEAELLLASPKNKPC